MRELHLRNHQRDRSRRRKLVDAVCGQVPRLRAALHGGTIITAEIGIDHHKITYFGDTINTTARLESFARR